MWTVGWQKLFYVNQKLESMIQKKVYLAVDLGAESGRVLAGEFDGSRLELVPVNTFPNGPINLAGSMHWNITGLYKGILEGLALAQSKYGDALVSIGVDSWGVDYGFLDKKGHLLGVPYHYRDSRTDGMLSEVEKIISAQEMYHSTGIQSLFFNTLYQLVAELNEDSVSLKNADSLLFIPDLINFWLTGKRKTEITIASTGQLLNQETRDWDKGLLDKLRIPTAIFESLVSPGDLIGFVTGGARREIKCGNDLKVFAIGSHDTASAIAGIPVVDSEDFAYLSSGTWSLMGVELKEAILSEESNRLGFTNELGIDQTVRYLKNISGLWIVQECRRYWDSHGDIYDYNQLTSMASNGNAFEAIIDVDDPIFATMGDMPNKIADYCRKTGQKVPVSKNETIRIALEGLALKYREVLENLRSMTGKKLETLYIVGGGTQNKLLNQMAANATSCKVIAGPVQATSVGNIITQMMGNGEIHSLNEARQLIQDSLEPVEYFPEDLANWEDAYKRYSSLKNSTN